MTCSSKTEDPEMVMFKKKTKNKNQGKISSSSEVMVALDIGTSKVRLIAGSVMADGQLKVQGYLECRSAGVKSGSITDLHQLGEILTSLFSNFRTKFDLEIESLIIGVPGRFIAAQTSTGTATVQTGIVSEADRNRAIENARAGINSIDENSYEIIHVIPQNYITDISSEITNPLGQYAKKLDVNVHVIGCKISQLRNIQSVITSINPNILVRNFIYNGIAAADAVLTESEKQIGVCLIDLGAGSCGITLYDNNLQIMSADLNIVCGDYITSSIAKSTGLPMHLAEELKISYGVADERLLSPEERSERIQFSSQGQLPYNQQHFEIGREDLARLIHVCLNGIFECVINRLYEPIRQDRLRYNLGAGIVLTGGTANIRGIDLVLTEALTRFQYDNDNFTMSKVRIGRARGFGIVEGVGTPENMSDADKSVIIGLLRSARTENLEQYANHGEADLKTSKKSWTSSIKEWFLREL